MTALQILERMLAVHDESATEMAARFVAAARADLAAACAVNSLSWLADEEVGLGLLDAARGIIARRANRIAFGMYKVPDTERGRAQVEYAVQTEWQALRRNELFADLPPIMVAWAEEDRGPLRARGRATPVLQWRAP